jgi:uncharacterized membrane protein
MRQLMRFVGTTLVGGVLVILPVYLAILLLLKTVKTLMNLMKPISDLVPENRLHPDVIAVIVVVLACFIAGLVARQFPRSKLGAAFEEKVLERIPGYGMLRSATRALLGTSDATLQMALVEMEEGLVVGVLTEHHPQGWVTVFIPDTPSPASGALFLFPEHRVHPVDIPFRAGLKIASRYGRGAGAMLAALKDKSILKAT